MPDDKNTRTMISEGWRGLLAGACALALAGCAVTPEPLKREEVRDRLASDQYLLYAEQEPIIGPIDVNTAIARALKYNLDYRLKLMERALATGLWDVSRYDMLPKVVASAGYATRSNDSGGTSVSIIDGRETLSPSTSQERNRWLANAEFSWNLLDFGLSYYRARQLADETLISEERRRRVIQNIVQDTRSAYWRAVGSQRLAKKADELLVRVAEALEKSRQAEAQGLLPPVQALAYQRALLDATTLLNIRRQELEFSKRELAALMNVTPGTDFTLADEREPDLPQPPRNIGELEEVALENRPELREEDYRKRISAAETRKALLSILPGISIDFAGRYDSNKYLYNQSWVDGGVQIFGNLMRLLAYPSVEKANELRLAADDARRVALSMAVITQVRVAIQRYELSLVDLDLAEQSTQVDTRLAQYARVALTTRVDSELELVRTEARALIAEFQRYASYANAQAAYGRILNSLGVDLLPDETADADVNTLAQAVADQIRQAERDTFPAQLAAVRRPIPAIKVQIENVADPALRAAAEEAVARALRRAGYTVDAKDPNAWPLRMRFDLARAQAGVDRGAWEIRLERADGTLAGRGTYSSSLATQFRPSSMDAFTEAATVSQLRALDGWLREEPGRAPAAPPTPLTPTPPPALPAPAGPRGEAPPGPTAPAAALARDRSPATDSLGLLLTLDPRPAADPARR
jgi:outer membrane protein TolC